MTKIIAIANQKGGVGKTTTAVNVGIGLARKGKKVLLIDADSQGSLTASLGYVEPDTLEYTLANVMADTANENAVGKKGLLQYSENVDVLPSNIELSILEVQLVNMIGRETILKQYIETIKDNYDYIIIDCMPSLGMITVNALTSADTVLIPVQASYLPVKGLQDLIRTIGKVKRQLNHKLDFEGVLMTMVDSRTNYSKEIMQLLRDSYGENIKIFDTYIPRSVKFEESTTAAKSIFDYAKNSKLAAAYESIVSEMEV